VSNAAGENPRRIRTELGFLMRKPRLVRAQRGFGFLGSGNLCVTCRARVGSVTLGQ
jgi:hypothetical protein